MPSLVSAAETIRQQQSRDFSAALAEFWRSSGADRAYWRKLLRLEIADERQRLAASRAELAAATWRRWEMT